MTWRNQELILDDNPALRARVANMSLPKVRMFRVPTESGYEARDELYKNRSSGKTDSQ